MKNVIMYSCNHGSGIIAVTICIIGTNRPSCYIELSLQSLYYNSR